MIYSVLVFSILLFSACDPETTMVGDLSFDRHCLEVGDGEVGMVIADVDSDGDLAVKIIVPAGWPDRSASMRVGGRAIWISHN